MSGTVEFGRRQFLAATGLIVSANMILDAAPARAANAFVGLNCAGMESGSAVPGVPFTDYSVPLPAHFDYYRSRGLTMIRLPIRWRRVQPELNGALDPTYLGFVIDLVDHAGSVGMGVILDIHDYGGRGPNKLGDGTLTPAHFADLWRRLAQALVGKPGIAGYDLMNEPSNMPSPQAWPTAAQAATNAIRGVDTTTTLYIEGDNWSSAWSWPRVNANLDIQDPSDNIVYSAHTYFDRDSSGSHYIWAEEVAAGDALDGGAPLTTDIGVKRLTGFVNWLSTKGFRGHIGEMGVGRDNPAWLTTLDKTLAFCRQHNVPVSYWTAGPWYRTYPYGVEQQADGRDAVQMAVLTKYTGAAAPREYSLTGPDRGKAGIASSAFNVEYRGYLQSPVVITPNDGGRGGRFTPSNVRLEPGFNGLATFTYAATGSDTYTIRTTNSLSLVNPVPVGYSTRTDGFSTISSSTILNAIALKRVYTPFVGSGVTLRRASDGVERSFPFLANDTLDVGAISSWAAGSEILVVTASDQAPGRRHAGPVTSKNKNGPGGTSLPSRVADYPRLVLDGLNGQPVLRFAASRMDASSPIHGLTSGFTCFLVCKPTSFASMQRLLSWHFTEYMLMTGNADGTWQISGEADGVSMGIDPTAWHIYAVRWTPGP